jgi:hypothetical protein
MIEIKRRFWNDVEVTLEEYNKLDEAWKRTVEESDRLQQLADSEAKPKRKKK